MRIKQVEAFAISIPLEEAVADAVRRITRRDHLIVRIRTEEGLEGIGFSLGYDAAPAMVSLVDEIYRPMLEGESIFDTAHLWDEMYRQSIQAGRRGAALRTISSIDIALWDLRGKVARLPVMELLGVHSRKLRCYATGGYYRAGQTIDELIAEVNLYLDKGFDAVKLKVGRATAREDARRVGAVRKAVGDEIDLLLDANGGWPDAPAAISAMRWLEEYRPLWIEEPVRADKISAMARIAEALDTPVATGELEATRWAFGDLMERRAADVLQPDATVCGGVTEWVRIAHMAASFDIPVAPHYNWDIHSQLSTTVPNHLITEYFVRESGVKVFDDVLENPIYPVKGWLEPRKDPGFGLRFNQKRLDGFRIS